MTFLTILHFARPYRWKLCLLTLLMFGESLVALAAPWLIGQLAGDVFAGAFGVDWSLVFLLIGLLACAMVLRGIATVIGGTVGLSILTDLRALMHDHVIRLPLGFHNENRRGGLMALMTWEIGRLSGYLTSTLVSILPAIVTAIGAVIMMARIDPMLTLAVPILIPVFILVAKLLGRKLRGLSTAVQEAEAGIMAQAQQDLEILPAIKTFAREDQTRTTYRAGLDQARRAGIRELSAHAAMSPALQFIAGTAAVILLALAGEAVPAGGLTAASIVSFMLYAALLTRPISALANVWGQTQVTRGVLARLSAVLDMPVERGGDQPLARAAGQIRVKGLHFAYPGRPATLSGLDLEIAAGDCIALTGANGAGKTTLTALLMGLMPPDQGAILLDGQQIGQFRLPDLRRQFGHVPQRPLLFNSTIRDNIAFGLSGDRGENRSEVEEKVLAAARAAQAHDFITGLPEGYDTMIGDAGVRLSGGQSQRIALARALTADPPVLILDEATSMYDLDGESAFVEAAVSALKGRTVILITHRPATLALASRVLVLEEGKLREVK